MTDHVPVQAPFDRFVEIRSTVEDLLQKIQQIGDTLHVLIQFQFPDLHPHPHCQGISHCRPLVALRMQTHSSCVLVPWLLSYIPVSMPWQLSLLGPAWSQMYQHRAEWVLCQLSAEFLFVLE